MDTITYTTVASHDFTQQKLSNCHGVRGPLGSRKESQGACEKGPGLITYFSFPDVIDRYHFLVIRILFCCDNKNKWRFSFNHAYCWNVIA